MCAVAVSTCIIPPLFPNSSPPPLISSSLPPPPLFCILLLSPPNLSVSFPHSLSYPPLPSHSSSPTVMAYFSGTLFISSLSSNQTFTIPANLSAITQQQTLAVGTIRFNSLSPVPQSIRDIAVIASELQPLPGKLPYYTHILSLIPRLPTTKGGRSLNRSTHIYPL